MKFLSPDEETRAFIAQATEPLAKGNFINKTIRVRNGEDFPLVSPDAVDFKDVSPNQIVSVSASLIPFLENDDANRALMGSNMMRQAVPLIQPEPPIVGTGMETRVALDSRATVVAAILPASNSFNLLIYVGNCLFHRWAHKPCDFYSCGYYIFSFVLKFIC